MNKRVTVLETGHQGSVVVNGQKPFLIRITIMGHNPFNREMATSYLQEVF